MNYHDIKHDDMTNGEGIRVTLFVSGCEHKCLGCQNSQTWGYQTGIPFDKNAINEIYEELEKEYITGVTFSGGDPFAPNNIETVTKLIQDIKVKYPDKNVWVYTGYTYEWLLENVYYSLVNIDVLVDGKFELDNKDIVLKYVGSTNQRIVSVQESLKKGILVLWDK